MSIKIPISASVDTSAATSSIDSLIKKLQTLQNLTSKKGTFAPGSTQGLVNAVEAPRKISGKTEKLLAAASSSSELTKLLKSTSTEIQALTVGEAQSALDAVKKLSSDTKIESSVRNSFRAIEEELQRLIKKKLDSVSDSLRANLESRGNLAALIRSQGSGESVPEILALLKRVDASVVGNLSESIKKIEAAIDSDNPTKAIKEIESLLDKVDSAIGSYIDREQKKIRDAFLKGGGKSTSTLSSAVASGNAGEVNAQFRNIMMGGAGDLDSKQQKTIQKNARELLSKLPTEGVDAAADELRATLTEALIRIDAALTTTADKVEEVKVETVSAESKVEAAAESAGADVKKAVEKIAEVVEEAGEKALEEVTAGAKKGSSRKPRRTAKELEDEAYEKTLARETGRDRAKADARAARMSGGGGGSGGGAGGDTGGVAGGGKGQTLKSAISQAAQELQRAISIIKDVKGLDTIDDLVRLNRGVVLETNKFFAEVGKEFAKAIDAIDEGKGDIARGILFDSMLNDAATVSPLRGQQRRFTEAGLADKKVAELKAAGISLDPEQEKRVRQEYLQALAAAAAAYRNMSDATRNYNAKYFEEMRATATEQVRAGDQAGAMGTVGNVGVAAPVITTDIDQITRDTIMARAKITGNRGADSAVLIALGATDKDVADAIENIFRIRKEIEKANNVRPPKSKLDRLAEFGGKISSAFNLLQMTVGQTIMYMQDFLNEANKLEKTSATVSALTGDFSQYSKVMGIAAAQQKKFGGSLNEQLEGFNSLVPITKKFTVDIAQLDNIARRLAIVDPLQGFAGASIALKEFFSGDITSLSRRFEIDRATLNNIKGVGDQVAQLQELDKVLNGLGISNAVLEARANTAAASFDRFGGAIENVKALAGQGLQNAFGGLADSISKNLEFAGEAIAENLKLDEQKNQVVMDISKLASEYDKLRVVYRQPLGTEGFDKVKKSIQGTTLSMGYLIKETNVAIDRLNDVRVQRGEAPIIRYGRNENVNVALATQAVNLGVDPAELFASRTSNDRNTPGVTDVLSSQLVAIFNDIKEGQVITTQTVIDSYSTGGEVATGLALLDLIKELTGLGPGNPTRTLRDEQMAESMGVTEEQFRNLYGTIKLTNEEFYLVNKSSEMLAEALTENLGGENERKARVFIATNTEAKQLENRMVGKSGQDVLKEYFKGEFAEAINMDDPVKKGEKFLEIVQQIFNLLNSNGNIMLPIVDQIKEVTKRYNDVGFAIEHVNSLIEKSNSFEQQRGDNLRSSLAYMYEYTKYTDASTASLIEQQAVTLGLVENNNELGMSAKAQLTFIAQQERLQAKYTMEADRSVDAMQALSSLLSPNGKIRLGMQEIANLAVEMRQSFANITLNSLLPTASIQDQYMFQSQRLRSGTKANQAFGPRNQQDAEGVLSTLIGLYQQTRQEGAGGPNKQDELTKLQKDYNKDRAKAQKDHDKDMYDLNEKYLKDLLELQRQSELTKRATPLNFYKNMQGLENLTPEQRQAYAARFEEGRTEAGNLRAQGKFTAAEEVMQGTADLVFNEATNQNEILQNQKDIKAGEKDLGDLQKELSQEGDAAKKQEIQDKIKLKAEEIDRYRNNIANIESLKTMQFDSDNEVIVQARLKEETITTDYETELANRKKAHDENLAGMKTKYDENVADKMKADNAQRDNFIANEQIMARFADAAIARNQLAQGLLQGLPINRIDELYQKMYDTQNRAVSSLPEGLQQNMAEYFKTLSELKPNPTQEAMDLAESPMDKHSTAMTAIIPVMNRQAAAMEEFNKRFGLDNGSNMLPPYIRMQLGLGAG